MRPIPSERGPGIDAKQMKLVRTEDSHVMAIEKWFPDRRSCQIWGGPRFRFPFTDGTNCACVPSEAPRT
ncbi:hypothetical protein [Sorangium cellulosum]|nr:hypothetical protein [Sorangium cellulosum]